MSNSSDSSRSSGPSAQETAPTLVLPSDAFGSSPPRPAPTGPPGDATEEEKLGTMAEAEGRTDRMPVDVGDTLKQYELIRKLGQGGMGVVFLARDTRLGRLVAIKLILGCSGRRTGRFLAEARATARCRHENIVVVYEVDEVRGCPYMVLEYIEGCTLRVWMAQRGRPAGVEPQSPLAPVPPALAVELMIPVVRALVCAHEIGIVHRDLKPENILLDDSGAIKVLDFGIARWIDAEQAPGPGGAQAAFPGGEGPTRESMVLGTPRYMSPEQWMQRDIDPRTDLWAVGVMLHELVTGAAPVDPFHPVRRLEIVDLDIPVPSVCEKRPDVGPLGAVIDHCLEKRVAERIGSARELLAALEALVPGRTVLDLAVHESPFAGLSAFQEADAARFFGRDREIAALTRRLRSERLMVVAGPSGSGKSSFVNAGVIPALRRSGDRWGVFILRPGRHPLSALSDVLVQVAESEAISAGASEPALPEHDWLVATLCSQPGYLGARLRARCRREGAGRRILLFVDQLEELYTLGATAEERATFIACLEGAADDASSPLRVLLAVRSDFLERMAEERHFMTDMTRGLSFLPPMGREGLREALTRPVEAAGHRFESAELVDHMLSTLERTRSPLPLLQFTAAKLWEARDRERRVLTRASYDELGGIAGTLSAHADAVLAGLSAREQRLVRAVLLRLVTPERTRAVVSLEELQELAGDGDENTPEAIAQIVQHLAAARLLLIETGGERQGTTVELVHECLITRWTRLGQWLAESERDTQFLARLRAAAQQWEASGEAQGLLWRDRAAQDARLWYERRRAEQGSGWHAGLGKREERYLLAVVALAERARRLQRRLAMGVLASLVAVVITVSSLAHRASQEAARAQTEAAEARNAARVAAAGELQADPTTALAILREIEPPGVPRSWSILARWALHGGIAFAVLDHPHWVKSAAYSPDGSRIATACLDRTARIWNADGTGEPIVLRGHDDGVTWAVFSQDGKRVVTTSYDRTARVWSADGTGEPIVLRGHEDGVITATFSPDGERIVTASYDGTARVWNADGTGEPIVLRGHGDRVLSAAFSPDGERIVTASLDRTARIWNADGTGEPIVLRGHQQGVTAAVFSPDGLRIATASLDMTARVWSADGTGEPVLLRGHEDRILGVAFSPDGRRVATASLDMTARVWNADGTGEPLILRGHDDGVESAAFSPDGGYVVTASDDMTARVWDVRSRDDPLVLRGHEGAITSAAFSSDGRRIVTASADRTARVWSADGSAEPVVLRGHEDGLESAAFSPDGRRVVTASLDGTARVWSADGTGEPVILRGHGGGVKSAAFSPDGRRVVTASLDGTARVWSADGTGEPVVLRGHTSRLLTAMFSPDGARVVTASWDRTARVWSADGTGEPVLLRGHEDRVVTAVFSPDGARVVTASWDRTARVWSADGTGEPVVLRGHAHRLTTAVFSSDGRRVVTASLDGTARVWSSDGTGEPVVLHGHRARLMGAAFSPDGRRVVTASQDRTTGVWSADGLGEPLFLRGSDSPVELAAFSPDGGHLLTASDDEAVRVWTDLEPLHGVADPKLWTATTYCMPAERRVDLLRVPEAMARADRAACQRRVQEARGAGASPVGGARGRPGGSLDR